MKRTKLILKRILITIAVVLIAFGIGYGAYYTYTERVRETNNAPQVFASNRMLLELWGDYKLSALEPGSNRTLDKSAKNITTSEGQSYTMMRSVWMDDIDTFDKSWQWTKDNLQRDDMLMSWKFGDLGDGRYGILEAEGGQNTATDADVDIAFALLMASGRWKDEKYIADARPIVQAIWEKEVVVINGKPILAANDIERNDLSSIIVNPSYFSPYAYRAFAKLDPTHDWSALVDSSYDILLESSELPLDKVASSGLTPNWIRVDRTTGAVIPSPEYNSNYGFDALRTPWRMALDWSYHKEPRAKEVLSKLSVLETEWRNKGKLAAEYSHDGIPTVNYSTAALNGASMPYFDVMHPDIADTYYRNMLLPYYDPDTQRWLNSMSYYDDNWVWFGMAYHNDALPNLTELLNDR